MNEQIRLRRFLIALDELIQDNEYYDDDLQKEVCDITEVQCYDILMENEEFHLLTSEKVKGFINIFITDFKSRMCILRQFKAN